MIQISETSMYATHPLMVIDACGKYGKQWQIKKYLWAGYENSKFHLEVKGQRRIQIMNVRDTSSHGDTPMCQIWQANVKPKKVMGRTRICTDRQTDKRTKRFLYKSEYM